MKSTRNVLILSVLIHSLATTAWADFIGVNIGAIPWAPSLSGSIDNTNSATSISLIGDLSFEDPSQSSFQLILEHPIPLLPNIKFQSFGLESPGSSISNRNLYGGTNLLSGAQVSSALDLSHNDIVLYYEVLDKWINLDLGVDLKRFDREAWLADESNMGRVTIDETVPLIYLSARFDLPYSGFYIGADINSFSIGDNSAEDSTIKLGYESENGLGFEGGFKKFSLELGDVNNTDSNLEYDGIFLNGYIHF